MFQIQYDYVDNSVNNYLDYNIQYQEYPGDDSDYQYPPSLSSSLHRPQPPPGWSQHHRVISPQYYQSHSNRRQEVVERQDAGLLSGTGVHIVADIRT